MKKNSKAKLILASIILYLIIFYFRPEINTSQSLIHINLIHVLDLISLLIILLQTRELKQNLKRVNYILIPLIIISGLLKINDVEVAKHIFLLSSVSIFLVFNYSIFKERKQMLEKIILMLIHFCHTLYILNIMYNFHLWQFFLLLQFGAVFISSVYLIFIILRKTKDDNNGLIMN